MLLGVHVSAAGGVSNAVPEAHALGCEAFQVFTRNQRQWRPRQIPPSEARRFREAARAAGYAGRAMSHASYLINLCATDPLTLRRSRWALVDEIRRCERLGIPYLCVHPGAHMGAGEDAGLARVAESLRFALARTRGVTVLFENTAGQGTSLGWRLEHLGELLRVRRTGVCLDTCHLFAAGYDLRTPRAYERTMRAVEETIGLACVRAFHLNDSKVPLGSRVDRHEHIGMGGLRGTSFRRLVNDPRFAGIFGVLETPKAGGMDRRNLDLLKRMRRRTNPRPTHRSAVPPGACRFVFCEEWQRWTRWHFCCRYGGALAGTFTRSTAGTAASRLLGSHLGRKRKPHGELKHHRAGSPARAYGLPFRA